MQRVRRFRSSDYLCWSGAVDEPGCSELCRVDTVVCLLHLSDVVGVVLEIAFIPSNCIFLLGEFRSVGVGYPATFAYVSGPVVCSTKRRA